MPQYSVTLALICERAERAREAEKEQHATERYSKGARAMPYKHHADFVAWNRNYQRKGSAGERKDRATIEGRIIEIVRVQPGQHDVLTLYAQLRPEGWPVKMVERAVQDLLKARVLHWDGRTAPSRLALNAAGKDNPFARKLCTIEEERTA